MDEAAPVLHRRLLLSTRVAREAPLVHRVSCIAADHAGSCRFIEVTLLLTVGAATDITLDHLRLDALLMVHRRRLLSEFELLLIGAHLGAAHDGLVRLALLRLAKLVIAGDRTRLDFIGTIRFILCDLPAHPPVVHNDLSVEIGSVKCLKVCKLENCVEHP